MYYAEVIGKPIQTVSQNPVTLGFFSVILMPVSFIKMNNSHKRRREQMQKKQETLFRSICRSEWKNC